MYSKNLGKHSCCVTNVFFVLDPVKVGFRTSYTKVSSQLQYLMHEDHLEITRCL